jgi:hypothetical protein
MQVSGIQSPFNDTTSQPTKAGQSGGSFNDYLSSTAESGVQQFIDYMKETPAHRMFANFLNSHHISQSQFDAMPPKEQEALTQQFEQELKQQISGASNTSPTLGPQ